MEIIRRGRGLINSTNHQQHQVLQVARLECSVSTPVVVLSSERYFKPVHRNLPPEDNIKDAIVQKTKGDTYVKVYVRLLSDLGIIPYIYDYHGSRKKMVAILWKEINQGKRWNLALRPETLRPRAHGLTDTQTWRTRNHILSSYLRCIISMQSTGL